MSDYSDLVQRLRGPIKHPQQVINMRPEAADAIEYLMKKNGFFNDYCEKQLTRIAELEAQNEKLDDTRIEYIGMINKLVDERENLKKENEILKTLYNQAIDDAADLLNCVDLPREELAAAIRKLKR